MTIRGGPALGIDFSGGTLLLVEFDDHRVTGGDLLAARNAYIESLLLNPSDIDAKFNLELVNAALGAPQPPPDNQGGGQPGQQDDSDPPDTPGDGASGDPSSMQGEGGAQPNPGGADSGALGEIPPEGEGDSALSALEALQLALSDLDRDAPTREQALAILDALRTRQPRQLLSAGQQAPGEIDPEDR